MSQDQVVGQKPRFVAAKWERASATDFRKWATSSNEARNRTSTFGQAISDVCHEYVGDSPKGELARKLPDVLKSCDVLSFSQPVEAIAYAGLHLLDRYGRVMQVLEHLLQVGRLPLRKNRVNVLEVGSGPAPALYAARDFYAMLSQWSTSTGVDVNVAQVGAADSLERGFAWDHTLHHLSERLIKTRPHDSNTNGLPFQRTIHDLCGFNARDRHHAAVEQRTQSIIDEFDSADEYISQAAASRMAYSGGVHTPSAYDLIFMCNFLTQEEMTNRFEGELLALARSLTPGGALIVMGGVGSQYPPIYEKVRHIAVQARLTDISPQDVFDPNLSAQRDIVRDHVFANVATALKDCDENTVFSIKSKLPKDLIDPAEAFKLPKYQVLAFVNQVTKRS